jgi:hypothetical protein
MIAEHMCGGRGPPRSPSILSMRAFSFFPATTSEYPNDIFDYQMRSHRLD